MAGQVLRVFPDYVPCPSHAIHLGALYFHDGFEWDDTWQQHRVPSFLLIPFIVPILHVVPVVASLYIAFLVAKRSSLPCALGLCVFFSLRVTVQQPDWLASWSIDTRTPLCAFLRPLTAMAVSSMFFISLYEYIFGPNISPAFSSHIATAAICHSRDVRDSIPS
ncbi:hypothetical protein VTK73DRAFT_3224 [Phialemonium thermophilum]|uniref:Uncharacterized protein n=1 Tax=Phialemonium thermophilum TaxID=223376 RepID=A0ABR3Y8J2_9PEZI